VTSKITDHQYVLGIRHIERTVIATARKPDAEGRAPHAARGGDGHFQKGPPAARACSNATSAAVPTGPDRPGRTHACVYWRVCVH
jgi:hypothetical protein